MKYESVPKDEFEDIESQVIDFESLSPRIGFVRKVYSILSVQLAFTVAFSALCMTSKTVQHFILSDIGLGLLAVAAVLSLVVGITLMCYTSIARKVPTNYILLGVFTMAEAYFVGFICMNSEPRLVLMAASMTLGMTFALTVYAFTTKRDFTYAGAALFIAGMALLLLGIFTMFTKNHFLHVLYSSLAVVLYGFYLIYDTQLVMGGKRFELDMDDYVIGALILYIDIIEIFIQILKLLSDDKK